MEPRPMPGASYEAPVGICMVENHPACWGSGNRNRLGLNCLSRTMWEGLVLCLLAPKVSAENQKPHWPSSCLWYVLFSLEASLFFTLSVGVSEFPKCGDFPWPGLGPLEAYAPAQSCFLDSFVLLESGCLILLRGPVSICSLGRHSLEMVEMGKEGLWAMHWEGTGGLFFFSLAYLSHATHRCSTICHQPLPWSPQKRSRSF